MLIFVLKLLLKMLKDVLKIIKVIKNYVCQVLKFLSYSVQCTVQLHSAQGCVEREL
jgi:hypothetical protein